MITTLSFLGVSATLLHGTKGVGALESKDVLEEKEAFVVPEQALGTKQPVNLTLYHINPLHYPVDPINMNMGDLRGALYFDFVDTFEIFACSDPEFKDRMPPGTCDNGETHNDDIGVTQLVVEVTPYQNRLYGPYAMCNVCLDGRDPKNARRKCEDEEYVCDCSTWYLRPTQCTNPAVGRKRLYIPLGEEDGLNEQQLFYQELTGYDLPPLDEDPDDDPLFMKTIYALAHAAKRTWGFWYSTLDIGHNTTWRTVKVAKQVTRACHRATFLESLLADKSIPNNDVFPNCLARDCGTTPQNTTATTCWAECFAEWTLGPNATAAEYRGGGIGRNQLTAAWESPFLPEDQGGCPNLLDESSASTTAVIK